jgi:hypothetical protein
MRGSKPQRRGQRHAEQAHAIAHRTRHGDRRRQAFRPPARSDRRAVTVSR